jgi:hypothetical protein
LLSERFGERLAHGGKPRQPRVLGKDSKGSEITVKIDDGTEVGSILKGIEGEQVLFEGSNKVITFDHVEMALMEIGSEGPE